MHRPDLDKLFAPFNDLYGLQHAKEQIKKFVVYQVISRDRMAKGLPVSHPALHMAFVGPPGTGKTEFARRTAEVLHQAGLTKSSRFLEVSRQDLVSEHIGGSALKTQGVITRAMGGTLLVDEAYSLVTEKSDAKDFGFEALTTLMKAIEDERENLVCIFTGYPKEMQHFLDFNPGLRSRIGFHLHFPDYTPDELLSIAHLMAEAHSLRLTEHSRQLMHRLFERLREQGQLGRLGNGRLVRHLVEKAMMEQALRLYELGRDLTADDHLQLTDQDIERAISTHVAGQVA